MTFINPTKVNFKSNLLKIGLLALFITLGSGHLSAQINYDLGYIVKGDGTKTAVYLKDQAWNNNPETFQYKLSLEDNRALEGTLNSIKEFGIEGVFRYVKATVDMDQSLSQTSRMTNYPEPDFRSETVFLKQLVDGEARLYVYQNSKFQRFFMQLKESEIQPLVYKQYIVNQNQVKENVSYKKDLYDQLKNETINSTRFKNLRYDAKSLTALFNEYNTSVNSTSLVYKRPGASGKFRVAAKLGYFSTALDVQQEGTGAINTDVRSVNLGNDSGVRIAAELEYVLPFNKNKWALFIEPGYQSYSGEGEVEVDSQNPNFRETLEVEYNFIDVPLGLRHYMFLNDKNSIFINAAVVFAFDLSGTFNYTNETFNQRDPDINSSANLVFGIGYKYDQKIGIEGRVNTARNITRDEAFLNSAFSSLGVVLSYTFL
jgi:hypothetical protein